MRCKCSECDYIKGYRVYGERRTKADVISAKWFKCDSYVSDYVFAHCRDMVDLMRRGLWGEVRCGDGLLAQRLERHPYKMCVPGSIPG
jgi:hypothetical protein